MTTTMNSAAPAGLRVAGVALSLPVVVAAGCAIVGAGVLARDAFPTLTAVFAPSQRTDGADPLASYLDAHDKLFETSQKRWEGRYVFYAPPAPKPPPPPPPPPKPVEEVKPPPIQPAPTAYGGTKPTGIFGDIVFFGSDRRVPVGEKFGEVEVLGVKPPFIVKLGWTKPGHLRGEYDVSIWEYSQDLFSRPNPFPKTQLAGFKEAGSTPTEGAKDGEAPVPPGRGSLKPPEHGSNGSKPGDPKRGDPKSGGKPGDPKPGESKPGDAKPGDAKPGEAKPGDAGSPPPGEGGEGEGAPPPETVPANQPQRRYPPGQAPKSAAESNGQPFEPVPLDKLPPFRKESDIKAMNAQEAQSALQKINESLALPNLDDHNRARLENDAQLISAHLKTTK